MICMHAGGAHDGFCEAGTIINKVGERGPLLTGKDETTAVPPVRPLMP